MTALYRPPPGGIILFSLPSILLAGHYGYEILLADSCLDQGGSFNYENWTCSISETFDSIPYLQRHWGKAALALSFSLSGLIVWAVRFLKNH